MFLYSEAPLHPGTGSSLGIVDLPVQRERTTNFPLIQASALKGVLRSMSQASSDLNMLFGSDKQENAGAMSFSDARILLFPVRSLGGVFGWITCPAVLARLRHDFTLSDQTVKWEIPPTPAQGQAWVTASSALIIASGGSNKQVVLEEFLFQPQEQTGVTEIAAWLAENALPTSSAFSWWRDKLRNSLVVLSDEDFRDFVTTSTEVVARTRLDSKSKTVMPGALWYQEFIPAETMFYALVLAQSSRREQQPMNAPEVLEQFKQLAPDRLQIGGDESTGKGFCALRYI